jgi:hypothetical protein
MLEIRPICENCGKSLPGDSEEAMICTFECTFCMDCVNNILHNVCPNCGGGFEKRTIRPKAFLEKYPATKKKYLSPVDMNKFKKILDTYKNIPPNKR